MKPAGRHFIKQIVSLFALVRVQNVLLLSIAFVLTAKYIFAPQRSLADLLTDFYFIALLSASVVSIASGYIINAFYDYKKDLVNRPQKTLLEQQLDLNKRLYLYFLLNFIAVLLAAFISWRAALFFSLYIFFIWLYSHKIQHYATVGNLMATVLSIFPFFAIFLFFKKFDRFIFAHAVFLFLLLFLKHSIKSFVNIKGDLVQGNESLPIKYGEKKAKYFVVCISLLLFIPVSYLNKFEILGNMRYYFYLFIPAYLTGLFFFLKTNDTKSYRRFYNLIKLLLGLGVFSIMLVRGG